MIKHIVLNKLKDFAEGKTKEENALWMKENLEKMVDFIPELILIEVGIDFLKSERSWDVSIYTVFASKEDLQTYMTHPHHLELIDHILKIREDAKVVDYEI
jgi:hypothetical protein